MEVMRLVPTPQESMLGTLRVFRQSIKYSSRSLEAQIPASVKPASSSIFLAFLDMIGQISAVQTDAVTSPAFCPASRSLFKNLDGMGHTGTQGVVSIH